ncbi:M23 family metallopeptidase [Pelosinus sp. sgz500959]|uniref:M23 family metallopeptidase n=1 Tax=Pelosinus sp. sgz500959 TaxID=3242472 RepID=UPI00366CA364
MTKKNKNVSDSKKKIINSTNPRQQLESIRIPMRVAKCIAGAVGLLIILMIGLVVNYKQTINTANADKIELEMLRQTNGVQVKQIQELAQATAILQKDMERLNSLDVELRRIVNNEETIATSRAGLVRPSVNYSNQDKEQVQMEINQINNMINNLQIAVKAREESLVELKEELLAKQARLASRPSIWPTRGEVTSRFGSRNSPGGIGSNFHPGIDIANDIGTQIIATADGIVTESGWSSGYGETVEINHGNGITTLYGHNSRLVVHTGERVKKGQLIAYLGNTGYTTGPHLHYEIRVNGTAVNPASFLN